jgi:hypothetical protein
LIRHALNYPPRALPYRDGSVALSTFTLTSCVARHDKKIRPSMTFDQREINRPYVIVLSVYKVS